MFTHQKVWFSVKILHRAVWPLRATVSRLLIKRWLRKQLKERLRVVERDRENISIIFYSWYKECLKKISLIHPPVWRSYTSVLLSAALHPSHHLICSCTWSSVVSQLFKLFFVLDDSICLALQNCAANRVIKRIVLCVQGFCAWRLFSDDRQKKCGEKNRLGVQRP